MCESIAKFIPFLPALPLGIRLDRIMNEKLWSITITARESKDIPEAQWSDVVFDANVSLEDMKDTIVDALNDINAQYPLTYGYDLTDMAAAGQTAILYRIDTIGERLMTDTHSIYITPLHTIEIITNV